MHLLASSRVPPRQYIICGIASWFLLIIANNFSRPTFLTRGMPAPLHLWLTSRPPLPHSLRMCPRPWSSWTANSDKKYMELNGAALNVNKLCVTSRKTAFPKDK